jgi:hypothetical protein
VTLGRLQAPVEGCRWEAVPSAALGPFCSTGAWSLSRDSYDAPRMLQDRPPEAQEPRSPSGRAKRRCHELRGLLVEKQTRDKLESSLCCILVPSLSASLPQQGYKESTVEGSQAHRLRPEVFRPRARRCAARPVKAALAFDERRDASGFYPNKRSRCSADLS